MLGDETVPLSLLLFEPLGKTTLFGERLRLL